MAKKATIVASPRLAGNLRRDPLRPAPIARPSIGTLLRERRAHHGWTLSDVSRRTGVSKSALSKIENNLMSPTYHTMLQLCGGLDIEIGDLISAESPAGRRNAILGRRSVSLQHDGQVFEDENYKYTYLCREVAHKRIIPMVVEVRACELKQIKKLWSHVGETYIYVLEGEIDLLTELYEPVRLRKNDSCYFDSTMEHAYLAANGAPATLLVNHSSATPNLAQTLRDMLRARLGVGVR
jgi:transcriptional regulator with XRE-family HTH domain